MASIDDTFGLVIAQTTALKYVVAALVSRAEEPARISAIAAGLMEQTLAAISANTPASMRESFDRELIWIRSLAGAPASAQ